MCQEAVALLSCGAADTNEMAVSLFPAPERPLNRASPNRGSSWHLRGRHRGGKQKMNKPPLGMAPVKQMSSITGKERTAGTDNREREFLFPRLDLQVQKPLHTPNVHVSKIHHRPPLLNQNLCRLLRPAHRAQNRQRHHRGTMYSGRAVDEQLAPFPAERLHCEIHPTLQDLRWLGLKVVVNRIPQHFDSVWLGQ